MSIPAWIKSALARLLAPLLPAASTTSAPVAAASSVSSLGLSLTSDVGAAAGAAKSIADVTLEEVKIHQTPEMVAAQTKRNAQADADAFNVALQSKDLKTIQKEMAE